MKKHQKLPNPTAARNGTSVETEAKVSEKVKLAGVVCLFRISADAEKGGRKRGSISTPPKNNVREMIFGVIYKWRTFLKKFDDLCPVDRLGNHGKKSSFWCLSNNTMWIPAWQPVFFWTFKYISTYRAPFQLYMYNFIVIWIGSFLRFHHFMGVQIISIRFIHPPPQDAICSWVKGWSWDLQDDCCWRSITLQGLS